MKAFLLLEIALSLLFTLIAYFIAGVSEAVSFFLGTCFAIFNIVFFSLITRRILAKKSVATTLLFIIFKYSILGISLYFVVNCEEIHLLWFVIGLSILIPSVIGYIFLFVKQKKD